MQKVAAYLLERRDGMDWADARMQEVGRLRTEVTKWLTSKGASAIGPTGTYKPQDGGEGTFSIVEAADGDRSWWKAELTEDMQGRRFSATISITSVPDVVSVYVTLEAGWTTTHIVPGSVDPRCPKIVRAMLSLPGRWYHGSSTLRHQQIVRGWNDGKDLAAEIEHADRCVPIVVVSTDRGQVVLPELDSKLAYDLAGLANVVVVDDDAAWALTDFLGPQFACYWGAVRLYWPHFSNSQDGFSHPLWTASRLRSAGYDEIETRNHLRKQLRALVFRAAALSVLRPTVIDEIRDAVDRRTLAELRERATSLGDYKELADSYAGDNDQLRAERTNLRAQITELEAQIAKLDADRQALQFQLRAANRAKAADDAESSADGIVPGDDGGAGAIGAPEADEIRFYKKTYSAPGHDMMVRVKDCGCNRWEGAHAAPKAEKGIAKLESGRSDWKLLQHCASCTGGGMWRVRW